jgi:hypothetical protein
MFKIATSTITPHMIDTMIDHYEVRLSEVECYKGKFIIRQTLRYWRSLL